MGNEEISELFEQSFSYTLQMGQILLHHAPDELYLRNANMTQQERAAISLKVVPLKIVTKYIEANQKLFKALKEQGYNDFEKMLHADGMFAALAAEMKLYIN